MGQLNTVFPVINLTPAAEQRPLNFRPDLATDVIRDPFVFRADIKLTLCKGITPTVNGNRQRHTQRLSVALPGTELFIAPRVVVIAYICRQGVRAGGIPVDVSRTGI